MNKLSDKNTKEKNMKNNDLIRSKSLNYRTRDNEEEERKELIFESELKKPYFFQGIEPSFLYTAQFGTFTSNLKEQIYLNEQLNRQIEGRFVFIYHKNTRLSEEINKKILLLKNKIFNILIINEKQCPNSFKYNMYKLALNTIDSNTKFWLDAIYYVSHKNKEISQLDFEIEDNYLKYSLKSPCFLFCEVITDNKLDRMVNMVFQSLIPGYYIQENPSLFFENELLPKNQTIPIYYILSCGGYYKQTIANILTFSEDILNKISEDLPYSTVNCQLINQSRLNYPISKKNPRSLHDNFPIISKLLKSRLKIIPHQQAFDRSVYRSRG